MESFLINLFGAAGQPIFQRQQALLEKRLAQQQALGRSQTQLQTLRQTILPVICLYQALLEQPAHRETALEVAGQFASRKAEETARQLREIQHRPDFFPGFRQLFLEGLKGDAWESRVLPTGPNQLSFEIHRCLWKDACDQCGCPQLCAVFCRNDEISYGNLERLDFQRTQTLAAGGSCCDFHFQSR